MVSGIISGAGEHHIASRGNGNYKNSLAYQKSETVGTTYRLTPMPKDKPTRWRKKDKRLPKGFIYFPVLEIVRLLSCHFNLV
jgi:hypothetical protein